LVIIEREWEINIGAITFVQRIEEPKYSGRKYAKENSFPVFPIETEHIEQ